MAFPVIALIASKVMANASKDKSSDGGSSSYTPLPAAAFPTADKINYPNQDRGFYGHLKAGSWPSVQMNGQAKGDMKVAPPDSVMANKNVKGKVSLKGQQE